MGFEVLNSKKVEIKTKEFYEILEGLGLNGSKLTKELNDYGIQLKYKTVNQLINNATNWSLLYAWAVSDIVKKPIDELFIIKEIDAEEEKRRKAKKRAKYEGKV